MRLVMAASLLALMAAVHASPAIAHEPYGLDNATETGMLDSARTHGVSYYAVYSVMHCESVHFNPRVLYGPQLGREGERGGAQLHPYGLLRTFYAWGHDDPFDPYQAGWFIGQGISKGLRGHWHC